MAKTVVGLYDEFDNAQRAVQELVEHGFARDDIGLLANNTTGEYDQYGQADREQHVGRGEAAGISAGAGAAVGGLGGLLIGIGLLPVPGVGPALAAGPIAATLAGAGVGAAVGGLSGALFGAGVPEREAGYYAEGVRRGGTLVTVKATDEAADQAADIMNRHYPVNIEERSAQWRARGWTGYDPQAEPYSAEEIQRERTYYRTQATAPRAPHGPTDASGFNAHGADFRKHHSSTFTREGRPYEEYESSYRYGYDLADDERYRNRDWDAIRRDARRNWEERHNLDWENFEEAIRYGWERARGRR